MINRFSMNNMGIRSRNKALNQANAVGIEPLHKTRPGLPDGPMFNIPNWQQPQQFHGGVPDVGDRPNIPNNAAAINSMTKMEIANVLVWYNDSLGLEANAPVADMRNRFLCFLGLVDY